jgi:hypothetical protein
LIESNHDAVATGATTVIAFFDGIAGDSTTHYASGCGERASTSSADLVPQHATDHGANDRTGA